MKQRTSRVNPYRGGKTPKLLDIFPVGQKPEVFIIKGDFEKAYSLHP
jgi:hypothetical protein